MRRVCAVTVAATLAVWPATSEIVYVSSAGCDGDDEGCQNNWDEQKVVRAVDVDKSGQMKLLPKLNTTQEGMPAWMATSPDGKCLFITETDKDKIMPHSLGSDGVLTPGEPTWSGGINPVHASVSSDSKLLVVANYEGPDNLKINKGASIAAFTIGDACELKIADIKKHSGHSINPDRQSAAHVHSAYILSNGLIYSCDLGQDIIFVYRFSAEGKLEELHRVSTLPGLGPRHIAAHPTLPVLYVVCEMGEVVLTYQIQDDGNLTWLQQNLVTAGSSGDGSKAAELAILPDGSALYATNRHRENTVTVFSVDKTMGILDKIQQVEGPRFPRGMTLVAEGSVLLVAGQSHAELWTYSVATDGRLTRTASSMGPSDGVPANPAAFAVLPASKVAQAESEMSLRILN